MRREPVAFLKHIRLCLDRIDTFTIEAEAAFYGDAKTQDAVIRNPEIIGQAVTDLGSGELESRHPDIPWRQVAGLRNVLAHQSPGVDLSLVRNLVVRHLPPLRTAMEAELSRVPPPSA